MVCLFVCDIFSVEANGGYLLLWYGGRVGDVAYCIVRGEIFNSGVALFCWIG